MWIDINTLAGTEYICMFGEFDNTDYSGLTIFIMRVETKSISHASFWVGTLICQVGELYCPEFIINVLRVSYSHIPCRRAYRKVDVTLPSLSIVIS